MEGETKIIKVIESFVFIGLNVKGAQNIKIMDSRTGGYLKELVNAHMGFITSFELVSYDNQVYLISGSIDMELKVWQLENGNFNYKGK